MRSVLSILGSSKPEGLRAILRVIVAGLMLTAVSFVNGVPVIPEASATDKFEMRCGWFDNPTPGNISLYDRDGEWIIGVQGGHQVEGDWEWPAFSPRQTVSTNAGSYGYGYACLQVQVNSQTHKVLAIKSTRAQSLAACRQDRSLRRWEPMFK
jgi:hypothetical protein